MPHATAHGLPREPFFVVDPRYQYHGRAYIRALFVCEIWRPHIPDNARALRIRAPF